MNKKPVQKHNVGDVLWGEKGFGQIAGYEQGKGYRVSWLDDRTQSDQITSFQIDIMKQALWAKSGGKFVNGQAVIPKDESDETQKGSDNQGNQ
jgi:hypothetical protein